MSFSNFLVNLLNERNISSEEKKAILDIYKDDDERSLKSVEDIIKELPEEKGKALMNSIRNKILKMTTEELKQFGISIDEEENISESRTLSVSQMSELKAWAMEKIARGEVPLDIYDDMAPELFKKIYDKNPHETFDSNATRYVMDLVMSHQYGSK